MSNRQNTPPHFAIVQESPAQPQVLGATEAESLAAFLEGSMTRTQLIKSTAAPRANGPGDESLLCVLVRDADQDGYFTDSVSQLFVTTAPIQHHVVPGLSLYRRDGEWHASPSFCGDMVLAQDNAVVIGTDWIAGLHGLVRTELEQLLRLAQNASYPPQAHALHEVEVRINAFVKGGAGAFFDDEANQTRWEIAAAWPSWDDANLATGARVEDLRNRTGREIESEVFKAILKQMKLEIPKTRRGASALAKRREDLATTKAIPTAPSEPPLPELDPLKAELRLLRDYGPEADEVFSLGGQPELRFDLDSQIARRFPEPKKGKAERDLVGSLWWWKGFFPDCSPAAKDFAFPHWPDDLIELFQDNWERSAFFYEFRAREKGRYCWEPFGLPWVKLNYTQRGILAALWPPSHIGRKRLTRNLDPFVLNHIPHKARLTRQIDLNMSEEDFLKWALDWFREARQKAQEKGVSFRRTKQRMEGWLILQMMDRAHFLRETHSSNERSAITKVRREYEKACGEAGLEP